MQTCGAESQAGLEEQLRFSVYHRPRHFISSLPAPCLVTCVWPRWSYQKDIGLERVRLEVQPLVEQNQVCILH